MQEYYFLIGLGLIWGLFATIQDLRTREVANWLNFSLIAFGLVYRAFYSISNSDGLFFLSGLVGFVLFFALAHLFYYGKAFAGGDAKLMMGFGVILPYSNITGLIYMSVIFIFALFFVGSIWSLIYSFFIVSNNWNKFRKEFKKVFGKSRRLFVILLVFIVLILFIYDFVYWIMLASFLIFIYFLYSYVKALDICMIRKVSSMDLQLGDWLQRDVRVGGKIIKKSVHGLSLRDIKLLQNAKKKVLIKDGIPFTIAFLLALIFMGYFFLVLGVSPEQVFPF